MPHTPKKRQKTSPFDSKKPFLGTFPKDRKTKNGLFSGHAPPLFLFLVRFTPFFLIRVAHKKINSLPIARCPANLFAPDSRIFARAACVPPVSKVAAPPDGLFKAVSVRSSRSARLPDEGRLFLKHKTGADHVRI